MSQVSRRLLCRRKVLVAAGVAAAAVSVGFASGSAQARGRSARVPLRVPGGERFELLGETLVAGTSLGHGSIEAVLPRTAGAVPVVMRTPQGERFQVDILRKDPGGPAGVADTARLSLFVVNRGDGATRTHEAQAHAARALATWLAARETDASVASLGELLSHPERQRAHPAGVFSLWG